MNRKEILAVLTKQVSSSDWFGSTLSKATNEELKAAAAMMYGKPYCKNKIKACERELKNRNALDW